MLQACWYSIDEIILNTTIPGCQNISISVPVSGVYNARVYANDTFGRIGFSSSNFIVSVDAPSINPISPLNKSIGEISANNLSFVYTPTDLDLQTCSLWTNTNGIFSINQTNYTLISGQQQSFVMNLSSNAEASYLWAVECNDTLGHSSMIGNQTFLIDRTKPNVTLSSPTGTYTSTNNIPLTLSYSDASPVQCFYNVTFESTGNVARADSELLNCASTTFNVDVESNYVLWMNVNDSAGNSNLSRNSFTVAIPTSSGGSGGGGGGGGGSSGSSISGKVTLPIGSSFELTIAEIENLAIERGESESLKLSVENTGLKFLNSCHLKVSGEISEWISGKSVQSLSPDKKQIMYLQYLFQ